MSRWVQDFESHAFQAHWEQVKLSVEKMPVSATISKPQLAEIARLKKVVEYIDALLEASDPELVPKVVWDNFTGQCNSLNSQLTNFNNNDNFTYINSANNHLDSLLTYLSPYVRNGKAAAQAAGRAFRTYSNTINHQKKRFMKPH